MIVIGVDVHKHSLTAVAVDEAGRQLEQLQLEYPDGSLFAWAAKLGEARLWAVEDCRHVTRALERQLVAAGEELVRVPPKLTGAARRSGRTRGKSDPIDALAVARVALREPDLDRPRAGEERYRDIKLLVIHRDDLVDERRRCQQRLRWHLHQLDPGYRVPAGALDRALWLDRVSRWLVRRPAEVQVRVARDLVARCRQLTRSIAELDKDLAAISEQTAPKLLQLPGCGGLTPPNCSPRSARSTASAATHSSPATAASHRSRRAQAAHSATGSTAAATANSTAHSTASRSPNHASIRPHPPTSNERKPKAKATAKRSAASNDNSPAPSTPPSKTSQH